MSKGPSVSALRLHVKSLSELLGSSEAETAMLLKFCEQHGCPPSALRGCDWVSPRLFTKRVFKLPSDNSLHKALRAAKEAGTLSTWHRSIVVDDAEVDDAERPRDGLGIAVVFPLKVDQHEARSFWQAVEGGAVWSNDCLHNAMACYTVACWYTGLHADDYGAASVAQLEGQGGIKIWFILGPRHGKQLVGCDEFFPLSKSGKPWFAGISRVAKEAANNGWVLVQQPGHTVFVPPNFYHSVLSVPELGCAMDLFLVGDTRLHPNVDVARGKAKAWLSNYSRGDHNGEPRGDKDRKWATLDDICPVSESASKKRLKTRA
jgi:hypothetical protein